MVGGEIVRDSKGHATGWLKENAIGLVLNTAMQETPDVVFGAAAPRIAATLATCGVTGISDVMGMPGLPIAGREKIYMALEKQKALTLRVHYYIPIYSVEQADSIWREYLKPEHNTELVRFAGGKIWVDGGLDSGGADTSFSHIHAPTRYFDLSALRAIIAVAENLGIQVQFHVNGDKALEDVLIALEDAKKASGGRLQSHVLVHLAFAFDSQLKRIKALGLAVAGQPVFWSPIGFATEKNEYGDIASQVYNYQAVIGVGIPLGFGTDWPAVDNPLEDFAPLKGMNISTSLVGRPDDKRLLSIEDFLRGYTEGSASTVSRYDLGNLRPGASADMVVFNRDPVATPPVELMTIKVTQTWVNGSLVVGYLPPVLHAAYNSGYFTLTWTDKAILQYSPEVSGPYISASNATSPFVITNLTDRKQFYRLLAY